MICISEEELKIVLDIIKRLYPKCKLLAFGSRDKWTNKDYSDLDLAIEGEEKISFEEMSKIKDAFEESDLNFRVDIIDLKGISEEFKEMVMSGNKEIHNGLSGLKEGWKRVKLGEICIGKGEYGIGASAVEYSKELPTYLRITDINDDGTINKEGLKSVDDAESEKYKLNENDIVFARTGNSTGRAYFYDKRDGEFIFAGFLIKFTLNSKLVNPKYIKIYTQSENYKNWISGISIGSTRANINAKMYAEMPILLPTVEEQNLTVEMIESINEKIRINNEMNKTLEEMSQTIFKQWFVDFEFPNENGEPYKSSGGKMVESELGLIPEGWKSSELGEITKFVKGKKPSFISQFKTEKTPFKYLTINAFSGNIEGFASNEKTVLVKEEDVLMVMDGASSGIVLTGEKGILGSTLSKIECTVSSALIYFFLKQKEVEIRKHTTGSAIPHADKGYISNLKIPMPNNKKICEIKDIFGNVLKKINLNKNEVKELIKTRDLLLPKLMSGEIKVGE